MTAFLASRPVQFFELLMYLLVAFAAFDVLTGRSVRVGRGIMAYARSLASMNAVGALVGVVGFLAGNSFLFHFGWLIIGVGFASTAIGLPRMPEGATAEGGVVARS